MKKKYKKIFILLILIIIIAFIVYNIPHNYKLNYQFQNFNVKEEYNKKLKTHYLSITKNKKEYEFILGNNRKKKLIKNIDYYEKENITCLSISLKDKTLRPVCYQDDKLIDIKLINNEELNEHYKIKNKDNKEINTFNNITLYNLDNSSFLLWNYKGFTYLKDNIVNNIAISKKDVYNLKIIAPLDNYLLMADYNEDYNFNQFIILNFNTGKKEIWKIDYDISMDSYILGTKDKSIYLVDKKNKKEYEIVPQYQRIRIVSSDNKGLIYDNKFTKISLNKLVTKELAFNIKKTYNYVLEDDKLYLKLNNSSLKRLVTKQKDLQVVYQNAENIYYLSAEKLYRYNLEEGESLLLSNFEWNFNNDNMIFIYKK